MRKAFTLIELLVVIAIIAILAAILFPVFAQAKLAAKKTQALSNAKQLTLAVQMYLNDYDDTYLAGFNPTGGWGEYSSTGVDNHVEWVFNVQPYVKNIPIFFSPADSNGGQVAKDGSWAGVGISFGCNGYFGAGWNNGAVLHGPMGINAVAGGWVGWLGNSTQMGYLSASQITQPSSTVLLASHDAKDTAGVGCCGAENVSAYGPWGVIAGAPPEWGGWGAFNIPNGMSTAKFPDGPNGSVSADFSKLGIFTFSDGHAKALNPVATDPDPNNQPQNNLWDALR